MLGFMKNRSTKTQTASPLRRLGVAWLVCWSLLGANLIWGAVTRDARLATLAFPQWRDSLNADLPISEARSSHGRTKNIEEIVIGDIVLAADEETGELAPKRVVEVFRRTTDHLRIIRLRGANGLTKQELQTTDEHPFFVNDRGWIAAKDLQPNDHLLQSDGDWSSVISTANEPHPESVTVFNFEVEDLHTYFVAADRKGLPVLAHNTCKTTKVRHYTDGAGKAGISRSGNLRQGTYVTRPSEIPARSGHLQIEGRLEIAPGRGSHYIDVEVPTSSLRTPANGPRTSGGVRQFQLREPAKIDPNGFRRPPGRPTT